MYINVLLSWHLILPLIGAVIPQKHRSILKSVIFAVYFILKSVNFAWIFILKNVILRYEIILRSVIDDALQEDKQVYRKPFAVGF